jgi:dUTP pyrophosphatase
MELPDGYEAQVRPRSGLALKFGVTVLNTPGTIDAGYRGEVGVILANFGEEDYPVKKGDKVAQLVIAPVTRAEVCQVAEVDATERGAGGFGSSGR